MSQDDSTPRGDKSVTNSRTNDMDKQLIYNETVTGRNIESKCPGDIQNNLELVISSSQNKMDVKIPLNDAKLTALCGALSGFISGIIVCPLDVAKTRLQAQGLQSSENLYYRGVIGTMSTIVRDEGVRGLYKGLVPIILGYFPTWTIYFSVYEPAKEYYSVLFPSWVFVTNSCSAITAGAASTILTNPIWVVKTRLMLQTNMGENITHYKGTLDAFIKISKQEGIRTLYSGLVPSLLGLFHVAIHFPVYEKLKTRMQCYSVKYNDDGSLQQTINIKRLIMASSFSKMIASLITYPHEILRTRMQLKSNLPARIQHKMIPMIKTTYRNEGFMAFYSGFTANLLRTVPASAVTLVSFEYFRHYFGKS